MSNTRLLQASLPAERLRGARLVEDFRDALTVARNGWTAVGSPTYAKAGGVVLNGTTQYLTRTLAGELNSASLTIHLEFWPTANYTDNVYIHFFDASGTEYYLQKRPNASANVLRLVLGLFIADIPAATYGPYWKTGARNIISISGVPGNTNAYLNGVQILTGDVSPWAPTTTATLYAGARNDAALFFPGRITRLYIGHHTSTLAEHQAYYNQTMFNWRNRATVDLPLGTAQYDPTNAKTLDVSGRANHATLGNGAGVGAPTQGRGFMTFDGVNDYLSGIANPAGSYTVLGLNDVGAGWVFFSHNDLTKWTPIMTSGGFTGRLSQLTVLPEVMNQVALNDAALQFKRVLGSEV